MFHPHQFEPRHLGNSEEEVSQMLKFIGVNSLDELIDQTIPDAIRMRTELDIADGLSEHEYLRQIKLVAEKNKIYRSYIGQGFYGTHTPSPILRNIFQNPGWYTQYTPYQAEIAQGRLEALFNYQTMVADLTGLPIANALMASRKVSAKDLQAVSRAFIEMDKDPQGRRVLARASELVKLPPGTAFVASNGSEYGAYRSFYQTSPVNLR